MYFRIKDCFHGSTNRVKLALIGSKTAVCTMVDGQGLAPGLIPIYTRDEGGFQKRRFSGTVMSNMQQDERSPVVIGAARRAWTAAYELQKRSGFKPTVHEGGTMGGGISRTETNNGYRFDIGGHRFFTKVSEVEEMWHEVLQDDFITVPSQPDHYREKFRLSAEAFQRAVEHRPCESMRILLSY
ncbi:MAG: NAD(P)-binding protein [Defluviimonas denitrificans]